MSRDYIRDAITVNCRKTSFVVDAACTITVNGRENT